MTPSLRLSKRQGMKRCARYTLREGTQNYRKEELFKPRLAVCASSAYHPSGQALIPTQATRVTRAVDVLQLPGPASRLLLVLLPTSSPWTHCNGVQVSTGALLCALSFSSSLLLLLHFALFQY